MKNSTSTFSRRRPSRSRTNTVLSSVNSSRNPLLKSTAREDAHRRLHEHRGGEEGGNMNIQVLDNAINRTPLPLQQRAANAAGFSAAGGAGRMTSAMAMKLPDGDLSSLIFQSSVLNSFSDSKQASMRQGGGGALMSRRRSSATSIDSMNSMSLANMDTNSSSVTESSGLPYPTASLGDDGQSVLTRTSNTVVPQRLLDEAICPRPKRLTEVEYRSWLKQKTTITLRETPTIFLFHNQDVIVSSENAEEVRTVTARHDDLEKIQELHRMNEGTKFQVKGTITFIPPKKSIHSEVHPPVKVNAIPLQVTTWMLKEEFSTLLAQDTGGEKEEKGSGGGGKRGSEQDGGEGENANEDEDEDEDGMGGTGGVLDDNGEADMEDEDEYPMGMGADSKYDASSQGPSGSPPESSRLEKTGSRVSGRSLVNRANRKWLMADSLMSNLRIMERAVVQNYMEHLQLKYRGLVMDPTCYRYAPPFATSSGGGFGGQAEHHGGTGGWQSTPPGATANAEARDTLNPMWGTGMGGGNSESAEPTHPSSGGDAGGAAVYPGEEGMGPSVPLGPKNTTPNTIHPGVVGRVSAPPANPAVGLAAPSTALVAPGSGGKLVAAGGGGHVATAPTPGTTVAVAGKDASGNDTAFPRGPNDSPAALPSGLGEDPNEMVTVPEVEMSGDMEILWRFRSPLTAGRRVTCMAWNRKVTDVLVVGYSAVKNSAVSGSRRSSYRNRNASRRRSSVRGGSRGDRRRSSAAVGSGARRSSGRLYGGRRQSGRAADRQGHYPMEENSTDKRGLVCCWSLKNPLAPELALHLTADASVSAVAFSYEHPSLLAVGNTDGGIVVYDIQRDVATPSIVPAVSSGKHTGAVWELKWVARGKERGEFLMSVSADGRVVQWAVGKSIEKVAPDLMHLTRQTGHQSDSSRNIFVDGVAQADAAAGKGAGRRAGGEVGRGATKEAVLSRQCGGMCFDICPTDSAIYVVGTEDGSVFQCNKSQTESYDLDYSPHAELVYRIRWSPYSPLFFLTCSADWTTRLYRLDQAKPMLKLDSPNQDAVQDVAWSNTNALHFATVTVQGNVEIWSLLDTIYPRWTIQYKDRRRLNAVLFAEQETPVIVVGDEEGDVCVFALTSFLFSRQEFLDDEQERILEEAIRKQQA